MQDSLAYKQNDAVYDETSRRMGRPRSEESRQAILEATRRMLSHTPVQRLSIEAIAKKASVGKTTIYRWWPNKASVVMEAMFGQPGFNNVLPTTGNASDGICAQIDRIVRQLNGKNGRIIAELFSEAHTDPIAMRGFIDAFLKSRYDAISKYLIQGRDNGEFFGDIDIDGGVDMVLGPIFFRLLTGQSLDDGFAERFSVAVLRALRPV